jgi:hypothetical protein
MLIYRDLRKIKKAEGKLQKQGGRGLANYIAYIIKLWNVPVTPTVSARRITLEDPLSRGETLLQPELLK